MKSCILLVAFAALGACARHDDTTEVAPVALVKLDAAHAGGLSPTEPAYGIVEPGAAGRQDLVTSVDGVVDRIFVTPGTGVMRGTLVAVLRPGPAARLEWRQATLTAANADQALDRAIRLRQAGLGSEAEIDAARLARDTARATVASLRQRMSSLTMRAPASATVASIAARPGDLVPSGTTIATLVDRQGAIARIGITPDRIASLHPGQTVSLHGQGVETSSVIGTILGIDPTIDPQSRQASALLQLPAAATLAPGRPIVADLPAGAMVGQVTVAYPALLDDAGQAFVYQVANGVAHRRNVTAGPVAGGRVAIIEGLAPGAQIVTAGGTALADGMKVRVR